MAFNMMKMLVCMSVLILAALAQRVPPPGKRGCISFMGKCMKECELGTHAYTIGCGRKTPEPTCAVPYPEPEKGTICDYSACYCDQPTVREPTSNKCVRIEDCPKKQEECEEETS